jgi:mono/diheme cytochrome c family protein
VKDIQAPFRTPLNHHKGVSNAVIFAHVFSGLRDPELGAKLMRDPSLLKHHDMNAPPWWFYSKKERIYMDAFAPKTPRQLMPFAMSPIYSDEKFHSFEPNFVHIQAFVKSVEPPKYPYEIDEALAEKGRVAFKEHCSTCHGSYGDSPRYPDKVVSLFEVDTDPVRLTAVSKDRREAANEGWLQYYGAYLLDLESEGYIAPPLDGVWASAPYLHNGSVPTLYHLFNVDERPAIWKRDDYGYDPEKVGLVVDTFDAVPEGVNSRERRTYYDTSVTGSSNRGHTFPDDELDEEEKRAVMEYLKTL